MYYFALLQSAERNLTPTEGQAEMQAYTDFHARAAGAIRAGDALAPAADSVADDAAAASSPPSRRWFTAA
ncbi:MAG TPA: hypothetical protein PLI79_12315, partial [Mycobacterium sp.]|nr:hypothetical protein [Mycobacterium sp.]